MHGLELSEAQIEVDYGFREVIAAGENVISIVHGYHRGTVLKSYFQSARFIKSAKRSGYSLTKVKSSNPGISSYRIRKK